MSSRSVVQVVAVFVSVVLALHAVAGFLATSTPSLVAVFVMVVVGRLVWFYTR